jgi:putative heme-binding domain-containing protein
MTKKRNSIGILLSTIFFMVLLISFTENKKSFIIQDPKDPKITNLKLPEGFHAERLYGPSQKGEGSWVAMTFDQKGRIIASDQYGSLYRLVVPKIGDTVNKIKIEELKITTDSATTKAPVTMGHAHGLLWAFNSLYVMINNNSNENFKRGSGLYRLQDTNGDDQFDKVTLIKALDGEGEHGPHSIILSPDKKSLYVVAGNFTKIPKLNSYRNYPDSKIDNLFPLIKDPNGHDNTVETHGGWVAHLDSTGANWELIASGFRNPFDITFNDQGELFAYDSDMEWDFGTPWYRPTRIVHVTSGAEFGWRPGTDKWSPKYPDNLPAVINVGQGSPTNLIYAGNARFPLKYRKAMFAFDWSFGIIYAVHNEVDGASYKTTGEEFISGAPLPLTDGTIGPDGALYFLTGGRRLESDLYRVYYGDNTLSNEPLPVEELTSGLKTRRQLEAFHGTKNTAAVNFAWPYLKDNDRFIRYAARIAIENQPIEEWYNKILSEKDPIILTQAAIALARKGTTGSGTEVVKQITKIDFSKLSESQQLDLIRAIELIFIRLGEPNAAIKKEVANLLNPYYPAKTNSLNRELSKMLVYIDAPQAVEKTMALMAVAKDDAPAQKSISESSDLILRNPQYGMDIAAMLAKIPPSQQTWYANVLSKAKNGWTPSLQKKYFQWYYKAFGYRGGVSFVGFINGARKTALANAPKDQFEYLNKISGDSIVSLSWSGAPAGTIMPKGPGKNWKIKQAVDAVDSSTGIRNYARGKAMYAATLCSSCHQIKGEGGVAGPDLTQLGTRFSTKDILESIIEPSKTISDQFGSTVFFLKDGGSVLGRLIRQDNNNYYISQNPFATNIIRTLSKKEVARTRVSETSPMLPGMINGLNSEELSDLIAYLKAGGNKTHPIYASKK